MKCSLTDLALQTFNEFDAAFAFASAAYTDSVSGPESPSYPHSHDEHTGDESGDFFPSNNAAVKSRAMETRKRKPGNRKTGQPQDQILKRRVQNRAAQRSFRERQKEYVHDLESQVDQLKSEIHQLHENYQGLPEVRHQRAAHAAVERRPCRPRRAWMSWRWSTPGRRTAAVWSRSRSRATCGPVSVERGLPEPVLLVVPCAVLYLALEAGRAGSGRVKRRRSDLSEQKVFRDTTIR